MRSFKTLMATVAVGIGLLVIGAGAGQAAGIPNAAAVGAQETLVEKTHGYHRRWRRGHRHYKRYGLFRRYGHFRRYGYYRPRVRRHKHEHCHYRRYGKRCHYHWHRRSRSHHGGHYY